MFVCGRVLGEAVKDIYVHAEDLGLDQDDQELIDKNKSVRNKLELLLGSLKVEEESSKPLVW